MNTIEEKCVKFELLHIFIPKFLEMIEKEKGVTLKFDKSNILDQIEKALVDISIPVEISQSEIKTKREKKKVEKTNKNQLNKI